MKSHILVLVCLFVFSSFIKTNVPGDLIPLTPSPNDIIDFTVLRMSGGRVFIKWRTVSEPSNVVFEVMRKEKGRWFMSLGVVEPKQANETGFEYSFVDKNEIQDATHYCLRKRREDGMLFYSLPKAVEGFGKDRM